MIPYTDTVLIASGTSIDPDTGETVVGAAVSSKARVLYQSKLIRNLQGEQVVSAIKIYLPATTSINHKSSIYIGEKCYSIMALEEKKHLNGLVSHYVIYC